MKIPVLLNGRQLGTTTENRPVITRVYDKWKRIFAIKKVYHNPGKSVVLETKEELPYEVKGV